MKKILVRVVLALFVLLVVGLVVVFMSLNSIVKKGVETVGPALTKVEIRLGSANISPFSGSGQLSKLFVGNPTGYKTPSAIEVGDVKVSVNAGSLLSDTIVVNEVNVQAPQITLEGSLTGDNNLTQILANLNAAAGGSESKARADASPKGKEKKFIINNFVIEGGKVTLSLNLSILSGKSLTVPLPPIHLQDIGKAENGVTAAQVAVPVMKSLVSGVLASATSAVTDAGKGVTDAAKQGVDQAGKAIKGLGDLFKKK